MRFQGLSVFDERDVYLVVEGLKPACWVYLTAFEDNMEDMLSLPEENIDAFRTVLEDCSVPYCVGKAGVLEPYGNSRNIEAVSFYIGRDVDSLRRLWDAKDCYEAGLAYGYPAEAVEAFCSCNRPMNAGRIEEIIFDAHHAGVKIPSWFSYVAHIPERLDFVRQDFSVSTKALACRYENFVNNDNPSLAEDLKDALEKKINRIVLNRAAH